MNVLCYIAKGGGHGERLKRLIDVLFPKDKIAVRRTMDALREKLSRPFHFFDIGVFSPADEDELAVILSMQELMRGMRIILILPERTEKCLAMGHALRPRLISFRDSDFFDVAAVLGRMRERGKIACQANRTINGE